MWDLELELEETSSDSPPFASKSADATKDPQDGTVILDTGEAPWSNGHATERKGEHTQNASNLEASPKGSAIGGTLFLEQSSSLCPSESASQYGQPRAARANNFTVPHNRQMVSKYYAQVCDLNEGPLPSPSENDLEMDHEHLYARTPPRADNLLEPSLNNSTPIKAYYSLKTPVSSVNSIDMELQAYSDRLQCLLDDSNHRPVFMQRTLDSSRSASIPPDDVPCFQYAEPLDSIHQASQDMWDYNGQQRLQEDTYSNQGRDTLEYAYYTQRRGYSTESSVWGAYDEEYAGPWHDPTSLPVITQSEDVFLQEEGWNITPGSSRGASREEPLDCQVEGDSVYQDCALSSSGETEPGRCGRASTETLTTEISNESDDESVLDLPQYSQGRALLLGISDVDLGGIVPQRIASVAHVELLVGKNLKRHWLPQKM